MAFSSRGNEAVKRDAPLTDVLNTPALRIELATIVALCSDSMRRELLATFDRMDPTRDTTQADAADKCPIGSSSPGPASQKIRREESVQPKPDHIDSVATQSLRRAALTYFDKWQIDVLRRLGEVLSVRSDAVRKARADAKARSEAAAKAKKDKDFYDWADGVDEKSQVKNDGDLEVESILPFGFQAKVLKFPKDQRTMIVNVMLLLLLSLEQYTAHSRILMVKLTQVFQLPESILIENESKIADGLLATAAAKMSADESTKRQAAQDASARRWKIGLATVAGAALIGVTGGLAAPILAAGIGGIMGGVGLGAVASLLGPLATNMMLVGGLFGAYGGRMTGRIMDKYAREIKDFRFIPVSSENVAQAEEEFEDDTGINQLQNDETRKTHKLRVAIGISGSVTDAYDFLQPWKVFSESRIEAFGLRWEMDALMTLGKKISEVLRSFAWNFAQYQLLSLVFAGLWPFGLLGVAKSLDSPFAIAKTRSDKAGSVLADALINKVQGARPVTLVGYGLGARVIYSCLLQLAEHNAFGLVESAVLMGAPIPSEASSWRRIRAVVSGRVVNVLSADDYVLGFVYRASSAQMGIAGLQKIRGVAGVENYDFTDMVKGHDKYSKLVGTILQRVGFSDLDNNIIFRQQEALERTKVDEKIQRAETETRNQNVQDNALAREGDDGRIVLVDNEELPMGRKKISPIQTHRTNIAIDREDSQDVDDLRIQMEDNDGPLSLVDPTPEPDFGPDRETVKFGSGTRSFDLKWDYSGS